MHNEDVIDFWGYFRLLSGGMPSDFVEFLYFHLDEFWPAE